MPSALVFVKYFVTPSGGLQIAELGQGVLAVGLTNQIVTGSFEAIAEDDDPTELALVLHAGCG